MQFDRSRVSCSCEGGGKALTISAFGAFIGCFQSDGAESMAVKGLKIAPCSASEQIHDALVSM